MSSVTIPLLVREMLPEERSMVLSDWKKDLWDAKPTWGAHMYSSEWWAIVNHVMDNITLPSVVVLMACHRNEGSVPLCWLASRSGVIVHMHARVSVREEPELAAYLEMALRAHCGAIEPEPFNPFAEMKRRDQADQTRVSGSERRGQTSVGGQPDTSAGEPAATTGRVLQKE